MTARRARFLLGLGLAPVCAWATPAPAQADASPFDSDQQIIARASTLSPEERRYLVYLYARLNKPKIAEALSEPLVSAQPPDRQTLLVLASMYLEQKDAKATLQLARRFLQAYPGDHQGLYFLGAGHYLAKEFAEANRVLRDLKEEQFAGRKYPYTTDLAASAQAAGDWYRAMLAYQDLLRNHDLGDELRDEVRRVLDGIYREHLPRAELSAGQTRLDRAEVWRTGALHGRHLNDRNWLEVRYARDAVALDPAPGLVATRADRAEAAANLTTVQSNRWRTDVWAGAWDDGALGGGRVTYTFARQREVALEVAGDGRATDSLILEALNGRQHHLLLSASWLLEADLMLGLRAQTRVLRLAGQALGRATGVDVNVDYTLWRQGPRVTAGYRGAVARFSGEAAFPVALVAPIVDPLVGAAGQAALVSALVSPRINRHGTNFVVTDNLADAFIYRLTAGVDYDFELSSTGWNAALALSFFPRKSIELSAEAGYLSSAGASNAGNAATLVHFVFRYHF